MEKKGIIEWVNDQIKFDYTTQEKSTLRQTLVRLQSSISRYSDQITFSELITAIPKDESDTMMVNVVDPAEFTIENIRKLIANGDDNRNNSLRVSKKGFLFLSDTIGNKDLDEIAFKFETFGAGGGYVGEGAAEDDSHINWIYNSIKENWSPNPKSSGLCFTIDY